MKRTTAKGKERGILFSLDFSISFLLMLVMLLVFALFAFSFLSVRAGELSDYRGRKDRIMLLDSILKRPLDGNQAGIALFDASKRRTMESRTGTTNSINENPILEEFGLVELWIECGKATQTIYLGKAWGEECEVLSRAVFLAGAKCLLHAKFCGG